MIVALLLSVLRDRMMCQPTTVPMGLGMRLKVPRPVQICVQDEVSMLG